MAHSADLPVFTLSVELYHMSKGIAVFFHGFVIAGKKI